jgi:predicted nucleic acid-binding Zn ribbon protein
MADESEQLRRVVKWRTARQADNTVSLGAVLGGLIENHVSPQQARFGLITEAWSQTLPTELGRHCRIVDISSGRLKVLADSPSYVYELQLCSSEILEELARRCPRARIKEIKVAVG